MVARGLGLMRCSQAERHGVTEVDVAHPAPDITEWRRGRQATIKALPAPTDVDGLCVRLMCIGAVAVAHASSYNLTTFPHVTG